MLWISTSAGCPYEGRLGRTWTRWPPGPKRAQRWGMINFSGVAGRGGAERKTKTRSIGPVDAWSFHIKQHRLSWSRNSSYAAQGRPRCCLLCTQVDKGTGCSFGKHQLHLGIVYRNSLQQAWRMWYHTLLTLDQADSCTLGSAERRTRTLEIEAD